MKSRCYNPRNASYKYYGGKGIKVCAEWISDFSSFRAWAIENGYVEDNSRYSSQCTLDRIDPNGDYQPNNCRWVSFKTQERNRTNNHKLLYNGKEYTISELAEIAGISWECLYSRIYCSHWSIEKAMSTPLRGSRS